ncbi:histidine kinase [Winogradskyella sp. 3972H.M.0a.05]|uniref:sensor histidine kinase n=1 Tax=Winogradskyella sp. 3972H.M.0a.05 TaxID=2950277 RepID=UPI003391F378
MRRTNKNIILIQMLLWSMIAFTQSNTMFSRAGKTLPFKLYKTEDSNLKLQDLLKDTSRFKSPDAFSEKTKPEDIYWVQIDVKDELSTLSKDSIWYLRYRLFEYTSIFYNKNGIVDENIIGSFENRPKQRSILFFPGIPFSPENLFEDRYIYLKVQRCIFFSNTSDWKFLYISQNQMELIQRFYSKRDINRLVPIHLFTGICLVMFLFTLMFFIYSKRIEFFYYALYTLFLFLYLTPDIFKLHDLFFGGYGLASYTFFQVTQVAINLCYILFVMYYLNTKTEYPKLHIALKAIAYMLVVVLVADAVFLGTKQFTLHIYILDIERLIMSVFGLAGMIYLLFKGKNKLAYFVVIGSFLYMAGALGFLFLGGRIYMIAGSAFEILIFAAGLTYKIQQEYKEKLQFQQEAFLNKTKALRAQINPHFIFNSLSSIQHLVTKNDKVSALKYLSKFSRLTRNILESSIETNVVLNDEIKMLKDYLELESLRFDNAFNYDISVDEDLDEYSVEIPFMLLQPFVENAIIHGLLPKTDDPKALKIQFSKDDTLIFCEVDDNGIGRKAAEEKGHIHKREKKSRGLEVTKQRLESLGITTEPIEIIDKMDSNGKAIGTKVIIKIPIK